MNRVAPAAANKAFGILASYLEPLVLEGDKAARLGQAAANLVTKAAAGARDRPATMFPSEGPLASIQPKPVIAAQEKAAQAEAAAPAGAEDAAKAALDDKWRKAIDAALEADWKKIGKGQGYSFEKWKAEAYEAVGADKSGNIDPKRAAKILFPDDAKKQEKYLSDYAALLTLKTIDLQRALSVNEKAPSMWDKAFGGGAEKKVDIAKARLDFQRLRNLMETLAAGGGKVDTTIQKAVLEDLNVIMQATDDPRERVDLAKQLIEQTYGLGLTDLSAMGLE